MAEPEPARQAGRPPRGEGQEAAGCCRVPQTAHEETVAVYHGDHEQHVSSC